MSLKHGLLGLLHYGPQSGYDLLKTFRDSLSHFWQATTSQIYRDLKTMEEAGWVESEQVHQRTRPDRRVYRLSNEGRSEFMRWLSGMESAEATAIRSSFTMRVFFSARLPPPTALELVRAYAAACGAALAALEEAAAAAESYSGAVAGSGDPTAWKLSITYGQYMHRAGLAWAAEAVSTLTKEYQL